MEAAARYALDWEEPCYPGRLWLASPAQVETVAREGILLRDKIFKGVSNTPITTRKTKKDSPKHKKASETHRIESAEISTAPISLLRLVKLFAGDEDGDKEDDYGAITPTTFAFSTAARLIQGAIKILGNDIASSPVVDSQGGIRVTWRCGDRQVKLVCPATNDAPLYIYQSSATGNSVQDQNVTAEALAARLSLLTGRELSPEPARD